tara:strand:+ start:135 stop:578 length:444 start_codon:yes stop_codon:yes gene_type:complete
MKVILVVLLLSGFIFPQSDLDKLTRDVKNDYSINDLSNFGVLLAQKGYLLEAISIFKEVVSRDQLRDKAYNNLGNCYYDIGSKEEALEYYLKAIEINPNNEQSLQSIGQCYYEKGELQLALKYFKKSAQLGNTIIQDWLKSKGHDTE